jgi:2-desacetyl-2-hydroxyethyl bacteriochlorophyllide A dehydrogenase
MVRARSVWFAAPRSVELRTSDLPPLQEEQVLVRTSYSGISAGTELLAYRGELDPEMAVDETIGALGGTFRYPFHYGYSCAGVVEESRSPWLGVGQTVFAFHPHQSHFVADASGLVVLDGIEARVATLFPLVETALQITLDAGPLYGERVVVFGLGTVGALTALLLSRAGARVLGVDPRAWRAGLLQDLAVETVAPDDLPAALEVDGRQEAVPLIVEASGNPEALRTGLGLLAHEGTALVASWYGTKEVPLQLGQHFHRRRLTIRSSQVSTIPAHLSDRWDADRRRRVVAGLLADLPLGAFATHEFPVTDAAAAFAAIDEGREGVVHAALWYG